MNTVNIYLNFLGECEEAFLFYKSIFGGEFSYFSRFSELPEQDNMPKIPKEMEDWVMHVSLPISDETVLMGSDNTGLDRHNFIKGNNFSISVSVASISEADRIFSALSPDAEIHEPMNHAFWGDYFGTLTDKFGIPWMIICSEA
jgi:PhnB protein